MQSPDPYYKFFDSYITDHRILTTAEMDVRRLAAIVRALGKRHFAYMVEEEQLMEDLLANAVFHLSQENRAVLDALLYASDDDAEEEE